MRTRTHHGIHRQIVLLVSLASLTALTACGTGAPSNQGSCLSPSFACSGGFYSEQSPATKHSFSYEKWMPRLDSNINDLTPSAVADRFRAQKESGNFTILSMAFKTPTYIKDFIHSPEYRQFLFLYTPSIQQGLVDYLNVGEETDFEVESTTKDLRSRFPGEKFGSWPGRPLDLVKESDFYLFDDYKSLGDVEDFQFLISTGKPLILIINATPGLEDIGNSYSQIDLAREMNWPVMFFAVSEHNSAADYYREGETKSQFLPYYQMIEDVVTEQLKLR